MGAACSEVNCVENEQRSEVKNTSEHDNLTSYQDEYLSGFKLDVHANTDPIRRSSVFKYIEEQFEEKYHEKCPVDLHKYYNAY